MKKQLPQHLGPFRVAPVQNEGIPHGIVPASPCSQCGRGGNDSGAFRRTLGQATSGQTQFDGLAYLVGTLWPNGCWGD